MEILHREEGKSGMFYVPDGERIVARLTYKWSGDDKIVIDHTEVSGELKGKGVGKQLVAAAVKMARERQIRVIPVCPFVKRLFDIIPDYRDVLK